MTSKAATHPFLTMAARVFCRFGTLRYLPHCSDGTKRLIRGSQPTKNKIQERQFFLSALKFVCPSDHAGKDNTDWAGLTFQNWQEGATHIGDRGRCLPMLQKLPTAEQAKPFGRKSPSNMLTPCRY